MGQKSLIVGRRFLHVEADYLLALGHDDLVRCLGKGQRLFLAAPLLAGTDFIADLQRVLLKEPLSPLAARSPLAVIHPVNLGTHMPLTNKKQKMKVCLLTAGFPFRHLGVF